MVAAFESFRDARLLIRSSGTAGGEGDGKGFIFLGARQSSLEQFHGVVAMSIANLL